MTINNQNQELLPTLFDPDTKEAVAIYAPKSIYPNYILFTDKQFLLMYHLLRFGYFDREIADNLNFSLTGNKAISNKWFYSCLGNRNYPISVYQEGKDGRKKIYYLNRHFSEWLLEQLPRLDVLRFLVSSIDGRLLHSLKANRHIGQKPKSVHLHNLGIRRYVSRVVRELSARVADVSYERLNYQFSFPINHRLNSLLPDAVVSVMGRDFYFEYDRNNEAHFKLLGKTIGYYAESYYRDSSVFFIFDNISDPSDNMLHQRPETFLRNLHKLKITGSELTYSDRLSANSVSLYLSPAVNAIEQIAHAIMLELGMLPDLSEDLVSSSLNGLPYELISVRESDETGGVSYMIQVRDNDFELIELPIIRVAYLWVGLPTLLESLSESYRGRYKHVCLLFDSSLKQQFYPLPDDGFFLPLFL